jgi:inhibitor of the pro-sigma K processing machinery
MALVSLIVMAAVAIVLLVIFFKIIRLPLKWLLKFALSAAVGFLALFVLNYVGSFFGISLSLTWLNAIITGVLGVPGVILLLLFKYLL